MEVLTSADYSEIICSNEIESTIAGMLSVLEDSSRKHNELENQKWYQRMILTVFGKNKATVKEIKDNHNKLDKYIAEAITELYNQNRISLSYLVVLGNRINELSYGDNLLRRNLIEVTSKINEKIESVDHFHTLIESINFGMYDHIPKLVALISIVSSCDSRVYADVQSEFLNKTEILRKSLSEKYILSDDAINFEAEIGAIKELSINNIGVLKMQVSRMSDDVVVSELFEEISSLVEKMYIDNNPTCDVRMETSITYDELFNRLVADQKKYYEYLKSQALQADENIVNAEDTVKAAIDKTNCVGAYDYSIIPVEDEILSTYEVNNVLTIENETSIEGKAVYINNCVRVKAYLEFNNCIIHINACRESKIDVTDTATLVIKNCLIISDGKVDRHFINLKEGFFTTRNSVYRDVSYLLYENNSENLSTEVPIIELENIDFIDAGGCLYKAAPSDNTWRGSNGVHLSIKNCNLKVKLHELSTDEEHNYLIYSYQDDIFIENTIFTGIDEVAENEKYQYFHLISTEATNKIYYSNVQFENIFGKMNFFDINHVGIKDCRNISIESSHGDGNNIENLSIENSKDVSIDFNNCGSSMHNSRFVDIDNTESYGSFIKFRREEKKEPGNKVVGCTFSNIKSDYEPLICCFTEIPDSVEIVDSTFQGIDCKRAVLYTYGDIHLFFGKKVNGFCLRNNKGL